MAAPLFQLVHIRLSSVSWVERNHPYFGVKEMSRKRRIQMPSIQCCPGRVSIQSGAVAMALGSLCSRFFKMGTMGSVVCSLDSSSTLTHFKIAWKAEEMAQLHSLGTVPNMDRLSCPPNFRNIVASTHSAEGGTSLVQDYRNGVVQGCLSSTRSSVWQI